ncbi:MAG: hypothetical protein ACOYLX_18020 [Burkholderiaceae bacterium]
MEPESWKTLRLGEDAATVAPRTRTRILDVSGFALQAGVALVSGDLGASMRRRVV